MDSSSKPEPSTESSNTIPTKTGDNEQQKDSQTKPNSAKFSIAPHSLLSVGSAGHSTPVSSTSSAIDHSKLSATSSSLSFPSLSNTTTSTTSSGPHSVTISLGVGVLQVGKPQPRIPSPPKPTSSISHDVTATTSSFASSSTSSISITGAKDTGKTTSSTLSINNPFVISNVNTSNSDSSFGSSGEGLKPTHTTTPSQNQLTVSNSSLTPPVATGTPSTGGATTNTASSSSSAMKRPPSEISGSTNSSSGQTTEPGESEAGTEHKRKKMRKENNKPDRSDSPGGASHGPLSGLGRGVRNTGRSPSSASGGSNTGDASNKSASSLFTGKSGDTSNPSQDKSDESKNRAYESSVSSSSVAGGASTSTNTGGYGVSGNNNGSGGGPKVPPLKIVLQSHSHSAVTTASTTSGTSSVSVSLKNNANAEEVAQSSSSGSGNSFPYIVSSTTDTVNTTGNTGHEIGSSGSTLSTGKPANAAGVNSEQKEASDTLKETGLHSKTTGSPAASAVTVPSTVLTGETLSNNTSTTTHSGTTLSSTTSTTSITLGSSGSDKTKDNLTIGEANTQMDTSSDLKPLKSDDEPNKKDNSNNAQSGNSAAASGSSNADIDKEKDVATKEKESSSKETSTSQKEKEKPVRVTRSSQRILKEGGGTHTPNSPSSSSPKTSACPSPSHSHQTDSQGSAEAGPSNSKSAGAGGGGGGGGGDGTEKMDTGEPVELHPRKRKIKNKDVPPAATTSSAASSSSTVHSSSSSSTSNNNTSNNTTASESTEQQQPAASASNDQPMLNCFEMYLNIRKQIDRRRRNLFPVTPKPPKGFKDYLMNRGTYVLAGNANALAVTLINPSPNLPQQMKDFFSEQEKERHKLRLQHLVEKEKLVLSVEQEILRVHGRAARALSNQTLPFSVCTILKDQEVYNLLTPEQEEKDINARSRYNGRLFLSWLQDVDDKWDKIKEYMLLRHHNEAESLHAVQKMDWEWKMKEFGLCEPKATPLIDDLSVPMVHVSDDFDLLPA